MASIKQLKKKIHQQSFKMLRRILFKGENQNTKSERLADLWNELQHFQQLSLKRLNGAKRMEKSEKRAEIRSVAEQLSDKTVYFTEALKER